MTRLVNVEVACALPDRQQVVPLQVEAGCTAQEALARSDIASRFPELDLATCRLGIFAKVIDDPASHVLVEGDRVEIYRPLLLDPKEARRQRAAKRL